MKALALVGQLAVAVPAGAQPVAVVIPEYTEPTPNPKIGAYRNIHPVALVMPLNDHLPIGRRHPIASLQMGSRDIAAWELVTYSAAGLCQ